MNQSPDVKTRREISGQERYPIPHGKHRRPKEFLFVKREISSVATPHFLDAGHFALRNSLSRNCRLNCVISGEDGLAPTNFPAIKQPTTHFSRR
jgi:hypothetical protein